MRVYVVVAFWLTASDCQSGDSNGTVLGVYLREPTKDAMKVLLKAWTEKEGLDLEDDFGDPNYGVESQESEIKD